MKKVLACILSILLLATLAACDPVDYVGQVAGTWVCKSLEAEETRKMVLENMDLYEEEIALVKTPLYTAKTVTFNQDKTYTFAEDIPTLKGYLKEFYTGMLKDLYEGRSALADVYETDVSTMNEDDFYAYYASIYEQENVEALIDALVENTYNFESFEPIETGTYTIGSTKIMFDAEGIENDGSVGYSLKDGQLKLEYNDGTENYTRLGQ